MEPNSTADLQKTYKVAVIIGLCMMGVLLIYTGVVEFLRARNSSDEVFTPAPGPDVLALLRYAFLGVAAVEFFVIQFLRKVMLSSDAPTRQTSLPGSFAPEAQKLITVSVVTFALCESVAVYGLVLFLVGRSASDFYLFLLISIFYFAVFFPRYGAWEEWVQEREKAARRV
jgi:hypothetical protein